MAHTGPLTSVLAEALSLGSDNVYREGLQPRSFGSLGLKRTACPARYSKNRIGVQSLGIQSALNHDRKMKSEHRLKEQRGR